VLAEVVRLPEVPVQVVLGAGEVSMVNPVGKVSVKPA
jgi:hypothetical protein